MWTEPQVVYHRRRDQLFMLELPPPSAHLLPGMAWGRCDELFSPSYWRVQSWIRTREGDLPTSRLGSSLSEEVTACLLGGHGFPAEVGVAAFVRLRQLGLLSGEVPSLDALVTALREPLELRGRTVRYRFPVQKARYLRAALAFLASEVPPEAVPRQLREWLLRIPGIGLKTASWITRNWLGSDDVAIIDVHVFRAGVLANLFDPCAVIARDYLTLEERFLTFAQALDVRASVLDALMWQDMRLVARRAPRLLGGGRYVKRRHPLNGGHDVGQLWQRSRSGRWWSRAAGRPGTGPLPHLDDADDLELARSGGAGDTCAGRPPHAPPPGARATDDCR